MFIQALISKQPGDADTMLAEYWATVCDAGLTRNQQICLCLMGTLPIFLYNVEQYSIEQYSVKLNDLGLLCFHRAG